MVSGSSPLFHPRAHPTPPTHPHGPAPSQPCTLTHPPPNTTQPYTPTPFQSTPPAAPPVFFSPPVFHAYGPCCSMVSHLQDPPPHTQFCLTTQQDGCKSHPPTHPPTHPTSTQRVYVAAWCRVRPIPKIYPHVPPSLPPPMGGHPLIQ